MATYELKKFPCPCSSKTLLDCSKARTFGLAIFSKSFFALLTESSKPSFLFFFPAEQQNFENQLPWFGNLQMLSFLSRLFSHFLKKKNKHFATFVSQTQNTGISNFKEECQKMSQLLVYRCGKSDDINE